MIARESIFAPRLVLALSLLVAALVAPLQPAQAQSAIRILVNDEPITSYDIKQRTQMLRVFTGGKSGEKQAIEQLVDEKLMLQEAKRRNVDVTDAEIDQEVSRRAGAAKLSLQQFQQAMRQAGFDPKTFRSFVRANMSWARIVRARFRATVNVTDQDVAAALTGAKPSEEQQKMATEYMLQPVIFLVPPGSAKSLEAQRLKEANGFRAGYRGCDQALQQVAGSPGVVVKNTVRREESALPEQSRAELAAIEVGGMTKPERIREGFQVLGICAKHAIAGQTEASTTAREELQSERGELLARRYLRDLRSDAVIEYR
jgi:peptidyl-prolyl cis-trans isomerase SurA